jgi:hypothetical protein
VVKWAQVLRQLNYLHELWKPHKKKGEKETRELSRPSTYADEVSALSNLSLFVTLPSGHSSPRFDFSTICWRFFAAFLVSEITIIDCERGGIHLQIEWILPLRAVSVARQSNSNTKCLCSDNEAMHYMIVEFCFLCMPLCAPTSQLPTVSCLHTEYPIKKVK